MNRRRFIVLTACALATPAFAASVEWQGRGFGSALSLRLVGADPATAPFLFARIEAEITRIEQLFSLHRDSALTRLNRDGRLSHPPADMVSLLDLAQAVHQATAGAFDPTVQPLWQAIVTGGDMAGAQARIGFDRVTIRPDEIRLAPGQALTLNGIAQGWAADRIAALLTAAGFGQALIDMGEVAALGHHPDGRPWRAAIADAGGAVLGQAALADRALATSSPRATLIGEDTPHILGPQGQAPLWQTVAVSAPTAAVADALSTAFCLMPNPAIQSALAAFAGASLAHIS